MTNVDTVTRVPKPVMVMRSLRVPLALWTAAKHKADERGENISDVVRDPSHVGGRYPSDRET